METDITIVEVGPRDGLQNESCRLPVEERARFIAELASAGLREIEAVSFVSPGSVPQMADSTCVMALVPRMDGLRHRALVPNRLGMAAAIEAGVDEVAVFASASEMFSMRNINCGIDESFTRFEPVMEMATAAGIPVRGYLSCCFGCPYEGSVPERAVVAAARRLLELGCYEVAVSDTIGIAGPGDVRRLLAGLAVEIDPARTALHLHDTRGQAVANVLAGLDAGIRVFDASVGGLGGCPYAPGATGNLATEELVYLLESLGVPTGIDLSLLAAAGARISARLGRRTVSRVARALIASGALDAEQLTGLDAADSDDSTVRLLATQSTGDAK